MTSSPAVRCSSAPAVCSSQFHLIPAAAAVPVLRRGISAVSGERPRYPSPRTAPALAPCQSRLNTPPCAASARPDHIRMTRQTPALRSLSSSGIPAATLNSCCPGLSCPAITDSGKTCVCTRPSSPVTVIVTSPLLYSGTSVTENGPDGIIPEYSILPFWVRVTLEGPFAMPLNTGVYPCCPASCCCSATGTPRTCRYCPAGCHRSRSS